MLLISDRVVKSMSVVSSVEFEVCREFLQRVYPEDDSSDSGVWEYITSTSRELGIVDDDYYAID